MKKYLVIVLLFFFGCSKETPVETSTPNDIQKMSNDEYLINIEAFRISNNLSNFTFTPYYPDSIAISWTSPDTGKAFDYYIVKERLTPNLADFHAGSFNMRYTIKCEPNQVAQWYFYDAHYYLGNKSRGPMIAVYLNRKF